MRSLPFSILMMLLIMFSHRPCLAQISNVHAKQLFKEPYQLRVTTNKTTSLVFPGSVKSVDRGSADLLAQEGKGADNIVQLKAAKENFVETNLTVITANGDLYSFIVNYDRCPTVLTVSFIADTLERDNQTTVKSPASLTESESTLAGVMSTADKLLRNTERKVHGVKDRYYGIRFRLSGVYIQWGVMYYQLQIKNYSNIDYDVDMLRFYLRDQKRSKRTATQELELKPLYMAGNAAIIRGKTRTVCVAALPKFTIPDAKYLAIEMKEKNGGRNLLLKAHNRHIIHASVIMAP